MMIEPVASQFAGRLNIAVVSRVLGISGDRLKSIADSLLRHGGIGWVDVRQSALLELVKANFRWLS